MIPTRRDLLIGALALVVAPATLMASSTSTSPSGPSTPPPSGGADTYHSLQADIDGLLQTIDFEQVSDPTANAHYDHLRTLATRAQNLYNSGAPLPFGAETDPFADLRNDPDVSSMLAPLSTPLLFTPQIADPRTEPTPTNSSSSPSSPSPSPSPSPTTPVDPLTAAYAEYAVEADEEKPGFWELVEDIVKILLGGLSYKTFIEIMDEHFPAIWEEFLTALKNFRQPGGKGRLGAALRALLGVLGRNSTFWKLLAEKLGATVVGKIAAKVFARFLPFIGWALFIAELLLAIYNHFNKKRRKKVAQQASTTTTASLSPTTSHFGPVHGSPALRHA